MISYIKGLLVHKGDNFIIVECGNIGYHVTISGQFMNRLPEVHTLVMVYTYMYIREDEISLYGFFNVEELDIFKILIGVSGVGPKVAMSLLSTLSVNELRLAVISEDVKSISRANGIGAKGASRIILELKDKLKIEDMIDAAYNDSVAPGSNINDDVRAEVVAALTALGYTGVEAGRAVNKVAGAENMNEEQLLRAALKYML